MKHLNRKLKIALEEVADGKIRNEREIVIYAKLKNVNDLLGSDHKFEDQEQWSIKSDKGIIRCRKTIIGTDITYVQTIKANTERSDTKKEVSFSVTEDVFELTRKISQSGMIKRRYSISKNGLIYEYDLFLKGQSQYQPWIKIDIETDKDLNIDFDKLPIEVEEAIIQDDKNKTLISKIYSENFIIMNK